MDDKWLEILILIKQQVANGQKFIVLDDNLLSIASYLEEHPDYKGFESELI
jgi:hypothetical protein